MSAEIFRSHLLDQLPDDPNRERRVDTYYLPLAQWVLDSAKKVCELRPDVPRPLFVGINGPQGSGKTTLTRSLVSALAQVDTRAIALSIDDFYLTRAEQIALAKSHPDNPYLQQRGYPGTHDIALGERTLEALSKINHLGQTALCPVYDKSAHQGQGDRKPESEWTSVGASFDTPLDVVFLEGWMLGFCPISPADLPNPSFAPINRALPAYDAWTGFLDAFLHLKPKEISFVVDWRIEAEEKMKAQGKPGMSAQEIRAYIQKFLPAYETYLPFVAGHPPQTVIAPRVLTLEQDRLPC